jgi:Protein of unknown function (DUF4231)
MIACLLVGGNMADSKQLDILVGELEELVKKLITPSVEWYSTHTAWPRVAFRLAGVIVVVGSLLLPIITATKNLPFREGILTTVSLAVAIVSSLSTFYRWDSTWQTRTKAARELSGLLAKWELALKFAETAENPLEAARSATQKLFDDALSVVGSETNQFFTTVKFPEISKTN